MTEEQERQEQQARWRELAELLGVDSDPAAAAKAPAPMREPPAAPRQEPRHPAPSRPDPAPRGERSCDTRVSREPVQEERPLRDETRQPPIEPPALYDENAPTVPSEETPDSDTHPQAEEPSHRGGGRRRGRRGRRERSDREPDARRAPAAVAEDRLGLEDCAEDDPAGSGMPHKNELRPVEDDDVLHDTETDAVDDSEIDEDDNLSDWSVPSWQDLIASLYRPDR